MSNRKRGAAARKELVVVENEDYLGDLPNTLIEVRPYEPPGYDPIINFPCMIFAWKVRPSMSYDVNKRRMRDGRYDFFYFTDINGFEHSLDYHCGIIMDAGPNMPYRGKAILTTVGVARKLHCPYTLYTPAYTERMELTRGYGLGRRQGTNRMCYIQRGTTSVEEQVDDDIRNGRNVEDNRARAIWLRKWGYD